MSEQQVAHSFGPNMPTRIAGATQLLLEPGEVAPVPMYQPLVPFLGSQVVSGGASSSSALSSGADEWKSYPDRLNLLLYQGDDVQIPLYFQHDRDMSSDQWESEVRLYHRYTSTLVYEFTIEGEFIPAGVDTPAMTLVTLFLPRLLNKYSGYFRWELASASPYTGPVFPIPFGVEEEHWPLVDQIKTWLYGDVTVVPRLTETDLLLTDETFVPGEGGAVVVTSAGWVVGPNGQGAMTVITTTPNVVVVTPGQTPRAVVTTPEQAINVSVPSGQPGPSGPVGPTGEQGEQGVEGPPGGSMMHSTWLYNPNPEPPPLEGHIRTPTVVTEVYVHEVDDTGFNRSAGLSLIATGDELRFVSSDGTYINMEVSATPIDEGTWRRIPVTVISGESDPRKNTEIELQLIRPPAQGPAGPPGVANIIAVPSASWPPPEPHIPDALYVKVE